MGKNLRKNARNSGKEYKYYSTKDKQVKTKKEAVIGPDCACKRKCMINLNTKNVAIIETIFKRYWAIGNYDLQTSYLLSLSKSKPTAAQCKLGNNNTKRNENRTTYFVCYESVNYPVCRKAFASIHGVGFERIDYLAKKRNITNTAELDQRGQNGHHNKIPDEILKLVHEFMATLPVRASHYTRKIN